MDCAAGGDFEAMSSDDEDEEVHSRACDSTASNGLSAVAGEGSGSVFLRRLNRPVDAEKESDEVLGFLLDQEARLSRPLYSRCSSEFRGEYVDELKLVRVPQSIRSR
jgi:hypothetical protein